MVIVGLAGAFGIIPVGVLVTLSGLLLKGHFSDNEIMTVAGIIGGGASFLLTVLWIAWKGAKAELGGGSGANYYEPPGNYRD